jgi:NAD(P)H-dependent flavin oxidoreductase YrpB (nitropropane dioxygenase family)
MTVPRIAAALVFAAAAAAWAQTPAPAAEPADTSNCSKPDPFPGKLANNDRVQRWRKNVDQWQDCMKKHVADLQEKADVAVKAANAAVAQANAAVGQYNAVIKDLQAQADGTK